MHDVAYIENLLRARYGSVRRSKGRNGIELIVRCPLCGKRKLSVNPLKRIFQCWHGCSSGPLSKLISDVNLGKFVNPFERTAEVVKVKKYVSPGNLVPLTELNHDHQAVMYLKGRGFDPVELSKNYGIMFCDAGVSFAGGLYNTSNTIVIPCYVNGALIGWQSRLLYNPDAVPDHMCGAMGFMIDNDGDFVRPPKYFTMPGMDKGIMLWNFDWARRSDIVVICEGVFDAIAVGRCGVAAFGKNITNDQISVIKTYWKLAIIMLDPGDTAAEMAELTAALKRSIVTVPVILEGYKDAGDAPRNIIWAQITEALSKSTQNLASTIDFNKLKVLI